VWLGDDERRFVRLLSGGGGTVKHFFETINGWTSTATMNFYRDAIKAAPETAIENGTTIFAEVGVFEGRSLAFAGVEIVNSGKRIGIAGIDAWAWKTKGYAKTRSFYDDLTGDQAYVLAQRHLKPLVDLDVVRLVRKTSVEAAAEARDDSLACVYIDANHSYEGVKADIAAWLPKVKSGGMIGGHDYSPKSWPGVIRAVDEAFGKKISVELTVWRVTKP